MYGDRFLKGKSRLIQRESDVYQKKKLSRRVGITIPEDTVTIPKIGQWSLGSSNLTAPTMKPPQRPKTSITDRIEKEDNAEDTNEINSTMQNISTIKPVSRISNRPTTSKKKLTKISIPKAPNNKSNLNEKLVDFPQGTVTTDIDDILRSKYRRPSTVVPPIDSNTEIPEDFSIDTRFLPLEYFDDSTYEEFSIEELMKDRKAYSQYSNNGQIKWEECKVLNYNEENEYFTIEWKKTKKQKIVPRFNIRFARENPEKFQERIEAARLNCKHFENILRFNAQVDMRSLNFLPSLSEKDFDEIHSKVNIKLEGKYLTIQKQLDEEVKLNFKKLENQFEFEYELTQNPLIPYRNEFLSLIPKPKPVPPNGLVCDTHINFSRLLDKISEYHICADPILQEGLFNAWEIFQNTQSSTFYNSGFPKEVLTLEEYIKRQQNLLTDTTKSFKQSIQEILEGVISSTMTTQTETSNKFPKMVIVTIRMLHTVLLRIVQKTLDQFISLFESYTKNKDEIKNPQFIVDLIFDKNLNMLESLPSYNEFQEKIGNLLNDLEQTVIKLPCFKLFLIDVDTSTVSFADCVKFIDSKKQVLADFVSFLFKPISDFINEKRFFEEFLKLDPTEYAQKFDPKGKRSLEEYRSQINDCNKILHIVQHEMLNKYDSGLFRISCVDFKKKASDHLNSLVYSFLTRVKKFAVESIEEINKEFNEITENLKKAPQTPEELGNLVQYIKNIHKTEDIRSEKIQQSTQRFTFLDQYQFETTNEEVAKHYQALQMPLKINVMIEETERSITVIKTKMTSELRKQRFNLEQESLSVTEELTQFRNNYNDLEMAVEAADEINLIEKKIQKLRQLNDTYTNHEKLLENEQNPSHSLRNLVEEYAPLHILWNLANEWFSANATWLDTPFPQVRADIMSQFMLQATKKVTKLRRELNNKLLMDGVLKPLAKQIESFKEKCPLIVKLRHPGIKTKHWEEISKIVGFEVMPSMELSLQDFLNLNLEKWSDEIFEIANVAALEYSLESSLDQMDNELQTLQFITVEFNDSKQYILQQIDDIISTIDDQLVTTQTLLSSPYIKPMKKRANDKLAFLHNAHETLDAWVNCQKSWLYLQPIFTGTSIQQKLYKEAMEWSTVASIWSSLMENTHAHPEFLTAMSRDNILPNLKKCNDLLDSITKGLNAYLEAKRLGFPRFFFLSNDELISILSHTKDFDKIQESMQKLFEYVNSIDVTSEFLITHMNDAEGEKVELINGINGDTPEIEDWLNSFEEEMKNTLKENTLKALETHNSMSKKQWFSEYPAQTVLIASQLIWTSQVTQSFKTTKANRLNLLQQKYLDLLDQLTDLIRQPISHLLRQLISSMLINQVHNRDIINQLIEGNASDENDFKWTKQLRYYVENGTSIVVKSINNCFEYSYEYAGNSTRLVITPLTDRCYQTLLAAFKQFLSGAPSGPAGTGKTETVRDCAKALGRPCVVYNCSEEVTPEQMSQFFAGLSSSGSWSCFDEFNRINIEVLSVIAQQVRSIQEAISSNSETFKLDARTLKINPRAAICITMNPGYAGRTELPDNLKALFRPVAMMVPDFVFISEILLFSGGFSTASILAVKLAALFDLCRKQLSNARHYDWGLRAMKAILRTAGKAKRNDLKADESFLLVRTIRDCTAPKLISDDLPLFNSIITDVFPSVSIEKERPKELIEKVKTVFKEKLKVVPLPVYLDKCIEFHETTLVRHGIMLVGSTLSGKSTTWKAMEIALTEMFNEKKSKDLMPVHLEHLNPKAISIAELYGCFNPATSEWSDGVLSHSIRSCSFSEQNEHKWIIVDGPVDSLWIESMNSLLDDNKVLCLPNNERIQLGPEVKLIFEVDDLSQASPATVSRCGMVYFDSSSLTWEAIAESSFSDFEQREIVMNLCKNFIPSMKQFLEVDAKLALESSSNVVILSTFKLMLCFRDLLRKPKEITSSEDSDEQKFIDPLNDILYFSLFADYKDKEIPYFYSSVDRLPVVIEMSFIFCLVWSFGAIMTDDCRLIFDKFLREKMAEFKCTKLFPSEKTVFDYFADFSSLKWIEWCDGKTNYDFTIDQPIENQMIPTNESASLIFLTRLLIENDKSVILQGPQTSKTLIANTLIETILDPKVFDCHYYPLSHCSIPSNIGSYMMQHMHKHQGKFGPLLNMKLIFVLDNIGSPKPEVYGAQPPLELIRQFFDYGGWYNTKTVTFNNVINTNFIATLSKSSIPKRLMRHFYFIHVPTYSNEINKTIFSSLLSQRLREFSDQIKAQIVNVTEATINVFDDCKKNLLPIPSKLHYVFSFRNLVRVIRGILMTKTNLTSSSDDFLKLWYHEMKREFEDRLSIQDDRKWFNDILNKYSKKYLNFELTENKNVIFNKFSDESHEYKEVKKSPEALLNSCTLLLEERNNNSSKPISITLFQEAIDHLSAISRTFSMRRGHSMLVGVKSSGRKSLARLALFISEMEIFEIAITRTYSFIDWREDVKKLIKQCGVENLETAFIISDVQIIMNQQLEDLSNLVSISDIPQLFERDEFEAIKAELAQTELVQEPSEIVTLFRNRVQKNLHIIIVASPYGSVFKDSMLYFPKLRNEMNIDWYLPWSENALHSIAYASLSNKKIGEKSLIDSVVHSLVKIHKTVEKEAEKYLKSTKRFTAVTPSKYFELIQLFTIKLKKKEKETAELISKYENGVEKIKTTRGSIETMSKQLDIDIPVLQKTRSEVKLMLGELQVKQEEVEDNRAQVQEQSDIAEKEAHAAKRANSIAQKELQKAEPLLQEAQSAVNRLDKDSLVNIKKLHNPSAGMKDTFDAVCIMFGKNPKKVDGQLPGEKIDDYWPEAVSLLNDFNFIKNVQNFKMDTIPKEVINKLKKYVNKEVRDEKRKAALVSFQAVAALYDWVCASYDYWFVYQEILPKKRNAERTAKKLEETKAILQKAQEHLATVEAKLAELMGNVKEMQKKENELSQNVTNTQKRLERAQKLLSGLEGETNRWIESANKLKNSSEFILGDSILISSSLTYLGAFSPTFRAEILENWKKILKEAELKFNENLTIENSIGNEAVIRDWVLKGLPNDTHSIENALIIQESESCFPLLIDPQLSGTKWLQAVLGEQLNLLRFDQPDFLQILKTCISFGNSVLIENVGLKLDPLIDPILSREISNIDGQKKICLGGENIDYDDHFRLYISTKYPNPHYSPEVCSQMTLINFTTTQDGLSDLLINNLLEVEKSELEKMRVNIMEAKAENMKKLKQAEDEILMIVSNSGGDILDDDTAIETLQKAQVTSADIEKQMQAAEKTEEEISEFKKQFLPVSERAALLYFCVSDFSVIDPMYQFSLKWFVPLFRNSIHNAEHKGNLVDNFNSSVACSFYDSVSFSLFSRHKLLFSTLMTIRILLHEKRISNAELAFLLSPKFDHRKSEIDWLPDDVWSLLFAMKDVSKTLLNVFNSIKKNELKWKKYYLSKYPESTELPFESENEELSLFQKLLILRVFHLEKVREGIRNFISNEMGENFVTPPTLNLVNIFKESDPLSPLIFIIMPGIDPEDEIINVSQIMETEKYLFSYSLGRGRGKGAEDLIKDASEKGFWVLLQNCHLSLSFMPKLEYIISHLDPEKTHERFRLCLVTMSSPDFPIGILYQGTKLIYEIPKGIRENVTRLYGLLKEEEYNENYDNLIERKMTFNIAFFHSVVLERLQFGSIGWNIPYEFNPSDFIISMKHMKSFLNESENKKFPQEELLYVIGELDYGGRVTDNWDRRLLKSILNSIFNGKNFSNERERKYKTPDMNSSMQELLETVSDWSIVTTGNDVGLGDNASTIIGRNESIKIFDSLVEIQPTLVAATESTSENQFALNLVENLQNQIPRSFNMRIFMKKFDKKLTMTTVLEHELLLYNNLISVISKSLNRMEKGLKGLILIDDFLEAFNHSLLANKVPDYWLSNSFPSILSLNSYMNDLNRRVNFLNEWINNGKEPNKIFLGGFFHPEEFLTAVLQVYARKHKVPFDSLKWKTTAVSNKDAENNILDEGVYIEGLMLEGAKWDPVDSKLIECGEKDLNNELPIMKLVPTQEKCSYDMNKTYECPVFRTQNRGTGALDLPNYIISLYLPTPNIKPDHWIQRSVAAFITI